MKKKLRGGWLVRQQGAGVKLDGVCYLLPLCPSWAQTRIPAARIRHDGISNWPIELKEPWWSSQWETKNIDHLKEERQNWFSRRQWAFTSYGGAHSLRRVKAHSCTAIVEQNKHKFPPFLSLNLLPQWTRQGICCCYSDQEGLCIILFIAHQADF